VSPGPLETIARRFGAKFIDLFVFGAATLVASRLFFPGAAPSGLIPVTASLVGWLGVFAAADATSAVLFGGSLGEWVMGIRVVAADGSRLSWSQRQDRTTDALVEGTVGLPALVRTLLRGGQPPYDTDHIVRFSALSHRRAAVAAAVVLMGPLALTGAAKDWTDTTGNAFSVQRLAWLLGLTSSLESGRFENPVSGATVQLPPGWSIAKVTSDPRFGSVLIEFVRDATPGYYIKLHSFTAPGLMLEDISAERLTTNTEAELGVRLRTNYSDFDDIVDDRRFDTTFVAEAEDPRDPHLRVTTLAWVTDREYEWLLALARRESDPSLVEETRGLALRIIRSTRQQR
jgi:RDD family